MADKFDRDKSDAIFMETLDLLDALNAHGGRFEYDDYVALHNNITALYDSFSMVDDELQELAKVKAEDRLLILPCKVGDTVYAITRCEDVSMYHDNDYFNGTGDIKCPFESSCTFEICNHENLRIFKTICKGFWLEEGIQGVFLDDLQMQCYISDFGKTVFFTREEAERALKMS